MSGRIREKEGKIGKEAEREEGERKGTQRRYGREERRKRRGDGGGGRMRGSCKRTCGLRRTLACPQD